MVNYPGVTKVWAVAQSVLPQHMAEATLAGYGVASAVFWAYVDDMDIIGEGKLTDKATMSYGLQRHEVELTFRTARDKSIDYDSCFVAELADGKRVIVGTKEAAPEVTAERKGGEKDGDAACCDWTVKTEGLSGVIPIG